MERRTRGSWCGGAKEGVEMSHVARVGEMGLGLSSASSRLGRRSARMTRTRGVGGMLPQPPSDAHSFMAHAYSYSPLSVKATMTTVTVTTTTTTTKSDSRPHCLPCIRPPF
ncbi:hypothetical protein TcWFU_010551 [Taenia crassiceps]|uniref:Uncharacterized protein n=1 Tax=Taenia crassiceps TaxID=6207 RepID=A0ABR4QUE3_9CEST